ncbi:MAG: hypothetical protein C0616_11485 [Desulfuromonas sp.]|nr:MAG: hypothetical protein C0616_11485 [Desulfuromonas sp.]
MTHKTPLPQDQAGCHRNILAVATHLFVALAAFFALSACGNDTAADPKAAEKPAEKTTQVEVMEVVPRNIQETFTLPGTLEAWENISLAAELAGPIRWIGPEEGDVLEQNEPILRIDTDTVKANLKRDRTNFEIQQRELDRYQQLLDQQLVSQQEYDLQRNALEASRANLVQAELTLTKSTVKTPVHGVLDRLLVDIGEYVAIGDPLAQVVQVDRLKVLVDAPEKEVQFLQPGQQVDILTASIHAEKEERFPGHILHVGYQADPASRTYRVKIAIGNADGFFRPGMILRARFQRRQHQAAIAIPLYALVDLDGRKVVYLEKDGVAHLREVETGATVGREIILREGIAPADRLIVKGQHLLTDGARVTVQGE